MKRKTERSKYWPYASKSEKEAADRRKEANAGMSSAERLRNWRKLGGSRY